MGACTSQQNVNNKTEQLDNTPETKLVSLQNMGCKNKKIQEGNHMNTNNIDPNLCKLPLETDQNNHTSNALRRLVKTMNEYIKTNDNNIDHKSALKILNDFHHFQQFENDELFEIMTNKLINCDITKCIMSRRNYRNRANSNNNKILYPNVNQCDDSYIVYYQILDKIHCYFQHTPRIGNTFKIDEETKNDEHLMSRKMIKRHNTTFNSLQNERYVKYNRIDNHSKVTKYVFGWQFNYSNPSTAECKNNSNSIIIRQKHPNLKTELTCNNIANINLSQFECEYKKAIIHMNTDFRKKNYINMNVSHAVALMTYCNFTNLSYLFSRTYYEDRGITHRNYYHLGKLLKEVVIIFGTKVKDGMMRHFYHGCSEQLTPEDIMGDFGKGVKIFIPLSTTSSLEVAMNFTNKKGLVMEFGGEKSKAKYYSTSWISDFASESEYLFLQNRDELQINNIIDIHNGYEYRILLNALRTISCIMSMDYVNENTISDLVSKLIKKIIKNQLNLDSFDSLTEYGKELVCVHFNNTETLSINYCVLEYTCEYLFELFCLSEYEWIKSDVLHCLFPNIVDIEIKSINLCQQTMKHILVDSIRTDLWKWNKMIIKVNKDSDLTIKSAILQYEYSLKTNGVRIADWSENMLVLDSQVHVPIDFTNNNDQYQPVINELGYESEALNRLTNAIMSYNNAVNSNHDINSVNINVADTLNDFLLVTTHSNYVTMQDIIEYKLENCDISMCNIFKRNYRDRNQFTDNNNIHELYQVNEKQEQKYDHKYIANCQILDKIHCFIQHSSDINNILSNNNRNNKTTTNKNMSNKILSTLQNRMCSKYNQLYYDNLENMYIFGCEIRYSELDERERKMDDNIMVITPMYRDIKEELIDGIFLKQHNANLKLEQFNTEEEKAVIYYNSHHRKQYYYEISISHLLVILIYCHYDNFEFVFSKSYRERAGMDHPNFYHFGKLLQECVLKFGTSIKDGNKKHFYHGINETLLLPQIIGDLCKGVSIFCPLSTSTALNVASRFTNNNNGLIIEFSGFRSKAKYFKCSWLSDFAEDECLFLQNKYPFQITNITDCKSGQSCEPVINALKTLETVMSQDFVENENSILAKRNEMIPLIIKIIKHQLSIQLPKENWKCFKSLQEYAKKLILVYFRNKTKLSINYSVLEENYPKLFKLFCLEQYEWININILYALFPNITDVDVKNVNLCSFALNDIFDHFSKRTDSWKINKMMISVNMNSDFRSNDAISQYGKQFEQIGLNITSVNWSNDILLVQKLK